MNRPERRDKNIFIHDLLSRRVGDGFDGELPRKGLAKLQDDACRIVECDAAVLPETARVARVGVGARRGAPESERGAT